MRVEEAQRQAAARAVAGLYLLWLIWRSGYTRGQLDAQTELSFTALRAYVGRTSDT